MHKLFNKLQIVYNYKLFNIPCLKEEELNIQNSYISNNKINEIKIV